MAANGDDCSAFLVETTSLAPTFLQDANAVQLLEAIAGTQLISSLLNREKRMNRSAVKREETNKTQVKK